jgi:hypothetical protein
MGHQGIVLLDQTAALRRRLGSRLLSVPLIELLGQRGSLSQARTAIQSSSNLRKSKAKGMIARDQKIFCPEFLWPSMNKRTNARGASKYLSYQDARKWLMIQILKPRMRSERDDDK